VSADGASVTIGKISVVARDLDASIAFYRRLGVSVPDVVGQPDEGRHAVADNGATELALDDTALARVYDARRRAGEDVPSLLLTAQLPSREAVDATYADLVTAGYRGVQVPWDAFWGSRYAIVLDPDGNAVGLEGGRDDVRRQWPPQDSPDA